ncbi:MarR family winged helix-turn-helix transcriptional regulator [Deinococcus cellulosilyticus]|uniref:MarR family transcriptional regulator n=1 Tax=Deinococcus cellulosilyticus (strain DSM 18568 / NBRC 106333 / KACC 11606 / 5516J-15) TaxID=1223518 RepID=A0A511MWR8_DEIC1|nr:MarR family winged helix-turn-helix transcriptional regulator [Deinococcus cellulosilyticus]GEM44718.1 MarR family transcriptional regulator [Deinococcus cellulosilyticus NBRC 106333 = KACC 11606]
MPEEPIDPTLQSKVITGLVKLSQVLKSQAWKGATPQKLTPTQGNILRQLKAEPQGLTLSQLALQQGITLATTSDAVTMLVKKQLVKKIRHPLDGRQLQLTLTPLGEQEAEKTSEWTGFLMEAVGTLEPAEQAILLQTLLKLIQVLQQQGQIAPVQMCFTCAFFQPNVYDDPQSAHHCHFLGGPLQLAQLQIDCADHRAIELPVLR